MSLDSGMAAGLGTVRIVGTGLLGTSIGLGLSSLGVRVLLADPSATAVTLARDLGAGEPAADAEADESVALVVVAAPPDVTAEVVAAELAAHPNAMVTDVASVKSGPLQALADRGADLSRYAGGHPMAGRERSGPLAARGDLFLGRPWVICARPGSRGHDVVRRLAVALGAMPVTMSPAEHDAAVALVSHVPQVAASLVAARLRWGGGQAVALAGPGVRDVTRIAGSDPSLWAQILSANAGPVAEVLRLLQDDLAEVIEALTTVEKDSAPAEALAARARLARLVAEGNLGREQIPGKHGGTPKTYAVLTIVLPDEPGALARLFGDISAAGTNVEELSLEHAPGREVGLIEVSVAPRARDSLERALTHAGWHLVA